MFVLLGTFLGSRGVESTRSQAPEKMINGKYQRRIGMVPPNGNTVHCTVCALVGCAVGVN
jgi:hypothetical protein